MPLNRPKIEQWGRLKYISDKDWRNNPLGHASRKATMQEVRNQAAGIAIAALAAIGGLGGFGMASMIAAQASLVATIAVGAVIGAALIGVVGYFGRAAMQAQDSVRYWGGLSQASTQPNAKRWHVGKRPQSKQQASPLKGISAPAPATLSRQQRVAKLGRLNAPVSARPTARARQSLSRSHSSPSVTARRPQ